jgi:hypothetical protein
MLNSHSAGIGHDVWAAEDKCLRWSLDGLYPRRLVDDSGKRLVSHSENVCPELFNYGGLRRLVLRRFSVIMLRHNTLLTIFLKRKNN